MFSTITECSSFRSNVRCDNFSLLLLYYDRVFRSSNFQYCLNHVYSFCLFNDFQMPVMFLRFKQWHLHEMSTNVRYIILFVGAWIAFNGNLMKYSNSAMDLLCIFQRFILNSIFIHYSPSSDIRWKMRANTNRIVHETIVLLGSIIFQSFATLVVLTYEVKWCHIDIFTYFLAI